MSVQQTRVRSGNRPASTPAGRQLQPGSSAVGMIGVGDMGGPIARSVLRAGYEVTAFDLRTEAVEELVALGAKAADSVTTLCATCDVAHRLTRRRTTARAGPVLSSGPAVRGT